MNIKESLLVAESRGVKLRLDGNNLVFRAPKGALTPELRQALIMHKAELIELLQAAEVDSQPPISRTSQVETEAGPLSAGQARLGFLDRLVSRGPLYNVHLGLRMRGALDVDALRASLTAVVERHAMLRATFKEVEGHPSVVVVPPRPWELPCIDLRRLDPGARDAELRRLTTAQAAAPFDLSAGPLMRTTLVTLGDDDQVLLVTQHHIITDAWSIGVFFRDLAELYAAARAGRPAKLTELPIRYTDYVAWQEADLQSESAQRSEAWWKHQLAALPRLDLPMTRTPPRAPTHAGDSRSFTISPELTARLRALAGRESCTLFVALLTVWATLLHRCSQHVDFGIGTVTAGRDRPELRELIGFFVNTLVLRCDLSGDPDVLTLMRRLRGAVEDALRNQQVPFDRVVSTLGASRGQDLNPLVRTSFVLENAPFPELAFPGLVSTLLMENVHGGVQGTAKFELGLVMIEKGGGLEATLEYATDLFDAATIERMLGHYQTLLEGLVDEPGQRVSALPLLTPAERRLVVVEWNATQAGPRDERCIHELFEAQVARTPDAVAVLFEEQRLSYCELNARANQLGHRLRELGVGPDVLVGLYVERSIELVVALLGILKAGGAYVPLDPTYPKERLAFMLEDTRAPVLITQESLLGTLPEHRSQVLCLDASWERIGRESTAQPVSGVRADHLAYVIYTSGSTGRPKGVLVEHRGVTNLALTQARAFGVEPGTRVLQFARLSFDVAVSEVFMALGAGGTLCLAPREALLPGPDLARLLNEQAINILSLPPAALAGLPEEPFPALHCLIVGGEPCSPELVARWTSTRRFFNAYGPTEATVCATHHECARDERFPPIGRPLPNTRVYILDPHRRPAPIGVPGELYIGGVGVARGYLNLPEVSEERFLPDPFSDTPGARLYRTGDLGRFRADGEIEYLGRIDQQVKIRGFRIELGEIESVLSEHPALREVAVLAREDAPGDKRLVAYVVPRGPQHVSVSDLRRYLQSKLPAFMVPAAYVELPALPLTPNGKIDRRALPAPEGDLLGQDRAFVGPRNPMEDVVAGIWAEVLRLDQVGIFDDFVELGGHSLLAVPLMAAIADRTGRQLPLARLFSCPTVAALAAELMLTERASDESPIVALRRTGTRRPFFCVHPAGGNVLCYEPLARALGADQPFYGLQARAVHPDDRATQTIEAMAERYLEAVRSVQPTGPYRLGGWSFGGLVAFEMARQLEAAGEEVAALVLIDTQIPRAAGRPGAAAFDDASVGFETFAADDLGLDLPASELVPLGAAAALAKVVAVAEDTGKLPHGHGAAILQGVKAVFQEAVLIAGRYKPRFLHGSLTLLRSRDPGAGGPSVGDFDWARFCGAPITVHVVPGTHQTMVRPPQVDELARRVREALGASGASHRPTTHIDWTDDQPPNNAPRSAPPRRRASETPASAEPIRPGRSGDLGGG